MTKNFSLTEPGMACPCCGRNEVNLDLLDALQSVRDLLELPIIITSGYRCNKHNISIGGKPGSSHKKGLAVDIAINSSHYGYKIIKAIMKSERFVRIGYGDMNGVLTLHLDIDPDKTQNVFWGY